VSEAWNLVISNIGMAIVITLIPFAIGLVLAIPALVGCWPMISQFGDIAERASSGGAPPDPSAFFGGLSFGAFLGGLTLTILLSLAVMPALQLGIKMCFWDMIRTRQLTLDNLTKGFPMYWSILGLVVLLFLIQMGIGFVVGLIGGVLSMIPILGSLVQLALNFVLSAFGMAWNQLAVYHMAARKAGAIDSLGTGWSLLISDLWNMIGLGLVCILINLVGLIACGLGVLVSNPVTHAAWGACYRDKAGLPAGPAGPPAPAVPPPGMPPGAPPGAPPGMPPGAPPGVPPTRP
jgi:hypothetical protein